MTSRNAFSNEHERELPKEESQLIQKLGDFAAAGIGGATGALVISTAGFITVTSVCTGVGTVVGGPIGAVLGYGIGTVVGSIGGGLTGAWYGARLGLTVKRKMENQNE